MKEFSLGGSPEKKIEVIVKHVKRELLPDERVYTPEEVYSHIEQLQGVTRHQFEKVTHYLNEQGILVEVELDLEEKVSREKFNCRTGYSFLLKVKPGGRGSSVTKIERFDYDKDGILDFARTVAECVDGVWVNKES